MSAMQYITEPYKIWIIDDFLDVSIADKLVAEWPKENDERWSKGHQMIDGRKNILESGMLAISNVDIMPPTIMGVMYQFHSAGMIQTLENITGESNLLIDESMRWSGMRVMQRKSYQLIHSDARKNSITGLMKHLTVLYYLNKNYSTATCDGCLEIWNDEMSMCMHRIMPIYNRLIIFENSETSYHGVPTVNLLRKMLTFSVMKKQTPNCSNRTSALFVPRPEDCYNDIVSFSKSRIEMNK